MNSAFVPASIQRPTLSTSFAGTALKDAVRPKSRNVTKAEYSVDDGNKFSLSNYDKYNDDLKKKAPPTGPSQPSSVWTAFRDSLKDNFNPFEGATPKETPKMNALAMTAYGRILLKVGAAEFGKGGDPDQMINTKPAQAADRYMAACIVKQYKQTAAPTGVYNVQCTEGTTRMQAEESRNAALSAEFRMKQRSTAQKFGDFCETRRKAIIGAHGCSYEEKLLDRFPIAARAYVTAGSESRGNCVRYATGTSAEESYMAGCVDKQMKFRAVPYGVYDVICNDGNTKNVAEFKRVSSLAARFRSQQLPKIAIEQAKFNNAKYARDYFGHGCSYEEDLFNKYPAVSASMRPSTARY